MKTIYELIKAHANGKGVDTMWKSTEVISDAIDESMPEEARKKLYYDIYGIMLGGHYDEEMAVCDVEKMFYIDENGNKRQAPYLPTPSVKELYMSVRSLIQPYNEWDFYVALHMVLSDNYLLLQEWFPTDTKEQMVKRYVDLTVNWLSDPDRPSKTKIWDYLH